MIKAPYNFVPLSDKVVMPFWAKYISHDIPFTDPKSGVIKLKITAQSPVYVRNGMPRDAADNDIARKDFNNIEQKYFIPGSSVKGMLRSVVEIMSFGRMKNKVNKDRYSVRDFQNNDIYPKTEISNQVECGWLYKKGGEYFIDKCGKPGRISHKNLDVLCPDQKIAAYYKNADNVKNDWDKSARSKNEKFSFSRTNTFSLDYEDVGRKVYKIDGAGDSGTIVMTGQSSVRKEPEGAKASGKHLEFIFWEKEPTATPVPGVVIKNLFFAYYDHDKTNQKEDWKWRKPQLENGDKIPVFYRTHIVNGKQEFRDIGLTMLFKITYDYSILDAINGHQKNAASIDLAEAIFGYVDNQKALKGRVHIGHAFVTNGTPTRLEEKTEVLAGPKASYYPNYIKQNISEQPQDGNINGKYNTFMSSSATIRGWKRYPVHSGDSVASNEGSANVSSNFIPLPANTEFEVDVAYHNLRKEELGAILSAITFHNTEGLFHSIGSAKPLGYGKIKVSIEAGLSKVEQLEAMKAYEAYMDFALEHSSPQWFKTEQIKELTAMAKPGNDDSKLSYMKLTEFANAKGKKKDDPSYALQKYSIINKNRVDVYALTTATDLENAKARYAGEKKNYENLLGIDELTEKRENEAERLLQAKLQELKAILKDELQSRRATIEAKEEEDKITQENERRLANRGEKQSKASEKGLVLGDFNSKDRNAFDTLNKLVINYAKDLNNKNENQLKNELVNQPWVQESDFDLIVETIKDIFKNLPNQKEAQKWKADLEKNQFFKKIALWIGRTEAEKLYKNLTT